MLVIQINIKNKIMPIQNYNNMTHRYSSGKQQKTNKVVKKKQTRNNVSAYKNFNYQLQ